MNAEEAPLFFDLGETVSDSQPQIKHLIVFPRSSAFIRLSGKVFLCQPIVSLSVAGSYEVTSCVRLRDAGPSVTCPSLLKREP